MKTHVGTIVLLIISAVFLFSACVFAQEGPLILEGWNSRPWLGVSISDLTKAKAAELKLPTEDGVLIDKVEPDSPAEKAGLQAKDVIIQFNGIRILTTRQFSRMIHELLPDRTVHLVALRNGTQKNFSATLGERPKPEVAIHHWPDADSSFKLEMEPLRKSLEGLSERFRDWKGPMDFAFSGPSPRRLGTDLESLSSQLGDYFGVKDGHGALITSVSKASPAEAAGLKAGDVIVGIDGKEVQSPLDVIQAVQAKESGTLEIKVMRDRQPKSFTAQIEKPKVEPLGLRQRAETRLRPHRSVPLWI